MVGTDFGLILKRDSCHAASYVATYVSWKNLSFYKNTKLKQLILEQGNLKQKHTKFEVKTSLETKTD